MGSVQRAFGPLPDADTFIWLDCDPGHDDAMAIILAGHTPGVQLLGVSTVAGNQTIAKVTQNALDILDAAGLGHIGVVPGQHKPLVRPSPILCPEIHGNTGLDGLDGRSLFPRSNRQPTPGKAVNVMFDVMQKQFALTGQQQHIRLVCTGALTNAALLVTMYPEVISMIDLVMMGGAMGQGNTVSARKDEGPVMEFNIQTDPEAAHIVLNCGLSVTMVPLEVTHTVLVKPLVLATLAGPQKPPSPFRETVRQMLLFFKSTYKEVFSFEDPPLHDPCAVAYVIAPHIFKTKDLRVDIETQSSLSAGQTICDIWRTSGRPVNCRVAISVDVEAFWELMLGAVRRADQMSALNAA